MAGKTKKVENKNLTYVVVVLVLVVILIWALKMGEKNYAPMTQKQVVEQNGYPEIEDGSDLDQAVKELDSTDLNAIDRGLNELNSDASSL